MPRFRLRLPQWGDAPRSSQPSFISQVGTELREYFYYLYRYIRRRGYRWFSKFESGKDVVVDLLYKRRGKYSRPFLHFGTITLIFVVITFGPLILDETKRQDDAGQTGSSSVLQAAFAYGADISTIQSEEVRQFRG